jgi:DNA-directed RNA polymerase subunit RPC12/RpoP
MSENPYAPNLLERPTCPDCGAKTKRNGGTRWRCLRCGKSFSTEQGYGSSIHRYEFIQTMRCEVHVYAKSLSDARGKLNKANMLGCYVNQDVKYQHRPMALPEPAKLTAIDGDPDVYDEELSEQKENTR